MSTVIVIERFDGGLLELDGWGLASTFFAIDPSSVGMGSYDSLCGRTRRDQIKIADVEALNRTMRARTAHDRWAPLIDTPLLWLQALDPAIDLLETADDSWAQANAEHSVLAALAAVVGPGRGVSVATKMLHLKRPRLFPILDRLVVEMLAARSPRMRRQRSGRSLRRT